MILIFVPFPPLHFNWVPECFALSLEKAVDIGHSLEEENANKCQFPLYYRDGQPYMHRKPTSSESMRKCFNNNMSNANTVVEPYSHERLKASRPPNQEEFVLLLTKKLEALEREQETMERVENTLKEAQKADDQPFCPKSFASHANPGLPHQANHHAFTTAILRKFSSISGDNDQDILDQHVSRVFSPLVQSPGTASPHQAAAILRPPPPLPHRTIDPMTEFGKWFSIHF